MKHDPELFEKLNLREDVKFIKKTSYGFISFYREYENGLLGHLPLFVFKGIDWPDDKVICRDLPLPECPPGKGWVVNTGKPPEGNPLVEVQIKDWTGGYGDRGNACAFRWQKDKGIIRYRIIEEKPTIDWSKVTPGTWVKDGNKKGIVMFSSTKETIKINYENDTIVNYGIHEGKVKGLESIPREQTCVPFSGNMKDYAFGQVFKTPKGKAFVNGSTFKNKYRVETYSNFYDVDSEGKDADGNQVIKGVYV